MRIILFQPGRLFPAVRITQGCELMCDHCRGRFLQGMRYVSPPHLVDFALDLHEKGGVGILISGGFDRMGRLLLRDVLPAVAEIKRKTDLLINIHAGQVDADTAEAIYSAGVDVASLDLVGDAATISEIFHLPLRPEDYLRSAILLKDAGVDVVPHITMGLHRGEFRGEWKALEMTMELEPDVLVLNGLVSGPVEGLKTVPVEFMSEARKRFRGRLVLGCMYERRAPFVDTARELNFDGAVSPGREALPACCALIRKFI